MTSDADADESDELATVTQISEARGTRLRASDESCGPRLMAISKCDRRADQGTLITPGTSGSHD